MEHNKNMTAVEWFYCQIPMEWSTKKAAFDALQQAKQMEKERAIGMYIAGMKNDMINPLPDSHYRELAEQYYNETYGTT
jgi:hypothetical protein